MCHVGTTVVQFILHEVASTVLGVYHTRTGRILCIVFFCPVLSLFLFSVAVVVVVVVVAVDPILGEYNRRERATGEIGSMSLMRLDVTQTAKMERMGYGQAVYLVCTVV